MRASLNGASGGRSSRSVICAAGIDRFGGHHDAIDPVARPADEREGDHARAGGAIRLRANVTFASL